MIEQNILNPLYYITNKCNFNCDYCCNKQVRKNMNYEPTKKDIDTLLNNLTQNYMINTFSIYGGEPTISENIFYLIDKLNMINCKEIKILTNASTYSFFKNLKDNYDTSKIYIYYTLHLKKYSEEYLNNLFFIKENFNKTRFSIILDKRYKKNLYDFYHIWKKHFSYDDTYFQVIRLKAKGWTNTFSLQTNEYSDIHFLQEFCKVYKINIKDLFYFKNVPDEYKNKLCCNNFIRIGNDGFFTDYQGTCFPNNTDKRNLYKYIKNFKITLKQVLCKNIIQPYKLCEYCTHE